MPQAWKLIEVHICVILRPQKGTHIQTLRCLSVCIAHTSRAVVRRS